MGGHGSWHLATLYPDRFAAVGPSAGWITIWSYRQDPPSDEADPLVGIIERGTLPSRTLEFAPNLTELGVYVLHEESDAGHWWDHSQDAGADCVSWPPMFDFFARHRRPSAQEVRTIRFRTPSPSVSAWNRWAGVITQITPFALSEIALDRNAGWSRVSRTTANVEVLALDWSRSTADSVRITLDGQSLVTAVPEGGRIWLLTDGGEAGWLWYQGNASIDVLPDTLFDPSAEPDRSVVLYGHAAMHEDWKALVDDALSVDGNRLQVGGREFTGEDKGLLAVRPRPGSETASVGLVAATGPGGFRLMNRRPYLSLGVAYPDVSVFEARDFGPIVLGAGYFANDWTFAGGEFVWEDGS